MNKNLDNCWICLSFHQETKKNTNKFIERILR